MATAHPTPITLKRILESCGLASRENLAYFEKENYKLEDLLKLTHDELKNEVGGKLGRGGVLTFFNALQAIAPKHKDTKAIAQQKDTKDKAKDKKDDSLLAACQAGNEPRIQVLLGGKAEVNELDKDGHTPLHWIAKHGSVKYAKILLDKKAVVDVKSKDGTALYVAARFNRSAVAELLIKAKAQVNFPSGVTAPLHVAIHNKGFETTKLLIACGADIEAKGPDGITAATKACFCGNWQIAGLITKIRCDKIREDGERMRAESDARFRATMASMAATTYQVPTFTAPVGYGYTPSAPVGYIQGGSAGYTPSAPVGYIQGGSAGYTPSAPVGYIQGGSAGYTPSAPTMIQGGTPEALGSTDYTAPDGYIQGGMPDD